MPVLPAETDVDVAKALDAALGALRRGEVVAVPTDTVYGLAADPRHPGAPERLFAAKERPRTVELPVLVADLAQALALIVDPPEVALRCMERWWPGPLTLVLERRPGLGYDLGENDHTIGLRCPDHSVPRAICEALGPIATTSANRHGQPPLTTADAVAEALGGAVRLILDGGVCDGAPSTVLDCTTARPKLLREGALGWSTIVGALD